MLTSVYIIRKTSFTWTFFIQLHFSCNTRILKHYDNDEKVKFSNDDCTKMSFKIK